VNYPGYQHKTSQAKGARRLSGPDLNPAGATHEVPLEKHIEGSFGGFYDGHVTWYDFEDLYIDHYGYAGSLWNVYGQMVIPQPENFNIYGVYEP
jgi:hypothetical protein